MIDPAVFSDGSHNRKWEQGCLPLVCSSGDFFAFFIQIMQGCGIIAEGGSNDRNQKA